MSRSLDDPYLVDFPLRGEGWMAVTTPAARVPSHGVDLLGQRFAYDLLKVDDRAGVHIHPAGMLRTLLIGVRTRECYAWGAPIHAPLDGEVVRVVDGVSERAWVHPLREAALAFRAGTTFRPSRLPSILGNHVILRSGEVHAAFVHLAPGTVAVTPGERVSSGDVIGRIGHTGNSTYPHLHFQLMDSADPMTARGIPCAFRAYEVDDGGTWVEVTEGIPGPRQRLRSIQSRSG